MSRAVLGPFLADMVLRDNVAKEGQICFAAIQTKSYVLNGHPEKKANQLQNWDAKR